MINSDFINHLRDEIFNFVNFKSSECYSATDLIDLELLQNMKKIISNYSCIDQDNAYEINTKLNEMYFDFCKKNNSDERFEFQNDFFKIDFNINSILNQIPDQENSGSDCD